VQQHAFLATFILYLLFVLEIYAAAETSYSSESFSKDICLSGGRIY